MSRVAHVADELHPVHARHVEGAHDDLDALRRVIEDRERRLAVDGRVHVARAKPLQERADRFALGIVVVHDEKTDLGEAVRHGRQIACGGLQTDRKSTRLNSSHIQKSRMPSSA